MDKGRAADVQNRQRDTLRVYTSSVVFYKIDCNRSYHGEMVLSCMPDISDIPGKPCRLR